MFGVAHALAHAFKKHPFHSVCPTTAVGSHMVYGLFGTTAVLIMFAIVPPKL